MSERYLIAIDQGTTSSRTIIFDTNGSPITTAQKEFTQYYPEDGRVEHDANEIWTVTLGVLRDAFQSAAIDSSAIAGLGITNQRETTVLWDRASGEPIGPAIVWQDRRTSARCAALTADERELITARTGLLPDPYFSATKVEWLLQNVPDARVRAERGDLAFGTIDTYLIWRLTNGAVHATDATNASRTMLFDIHRQCWDKELLDLFGVPESLLPEVKDCADDFGQMAHEWLGCAITIGGVAGDQQAATIGQACFSPGMAKSTYGTGCFLLLNTGADAIRSQHQLLSTVAYRLSGHVTYALEGSIFIAGAAIQWLRDGLRILQTAGDSEAMASGLESTGGVYLVPAFTGLGAPYWDPDARGAILGLTRDTGQAEVVRAALESVCFQTRDLLEAMRADGAQFPDTLRVDGGMVANNWVLQFLADQLGLSVERPVVHETTALGAAYLAGLHAGVYGSLDDIGEQWQKQRRFDPQVDIQVRDEQYAGWQHAVSRIRSRT
ncbi:MAG: glycerol kinase GlpK [Pseudomonadota bacterium]